MPDEELQAIKARAKAEIQISFDIDLYEEDWKNIMKSRGDISALIAEVERLRALLNSGGGIHWEVK